MYSVKFCSLLLDTITMDMKTKAICVALVKKIMIKMNFVAFLSCALEYP